MCSPMDFAAGPDKRITQIPPRPLGVAIATIVSLSSAWLSVINEMSSGQTLQGAAINASIDDVLLTHRQQIVAEPVKY